MSVDSISRSYWRSLPPLQVTMSTALKLPEYSATNPTGVTVGKRWRRHNGAHDILFKRSGGIPRWVICEYQEAPDAYRRAPGYNIPGPDGKVLYEQVQMCKTVTFRPVIRVKAVTRREIV